MENLTFTLDANTGRYKASFVTGDSNPIVYIYRAEAGNLLFYDSVSNGTPIAMRGFTRQNAGKAFRTAINTLNKEGVTITIESDTAVTNAYLLK